jgi:hypothetical protein
LSFGIANGGINENINKYNAIDLNYLNQFSIIFRLLYQLIIQMACTLHSKILPFWCVLIQSK